MTRLALLLCAFAASACGEDYELQVVPNGTTAPSGTWEVMPYDEVGSACERNNGRVLFRRPKSTQRLAAHRCYTRDEGNRIVVSLDLPEQAWRAQGWKRCAPDEEQSAIASCK